MILIAVSAIEKSEEGLIGNGQSVVEFLSGHTSKQAHLTGVHRKHKDMEQARMASYGPGPKHSESSNKARKEC